MDQKPSVGRIVHYIVDGAVDTRLREMNAKSLAYIELTNLGDVLPLLITRINDDGTIGGQVFPNGHVNLFVSPIKEGTERGCWCWPPRV